MKHLFLSSLILIFSCQFVGAMPENEAEFLYNNEHNSTVILNQSNGHTYVKNIQGEYIRDDDIIIRQLPSGIVETSDKRRYVSPRNDGKYYRSY